MCRASDEPAVFASDGVVGVSSVWRRDPDSRSSISSSSAIRCIGVSTSRASPERQISAAPPRSPPHNSRSAINTPWHVDCDCPAETGERRQIAVCETAFDARKMPGSLIASCSNHEVTNRQGLASRRGQGDPEVAFPLARRFACPNWR